MNLHPLFAGFTESSPYAVGAALGFAIHVETALGALPATLDPLQRARMREGGDLAGFQFAGGWGAPGAHCLMFAKPLTRYAATWWQAGAPCIHCYGAGFCVSRSGDDIRCPCGAPIHLARANPTPGAAECHDFQPWGQVPDLSGASPV
jgi:hypothetical protein